MCKFELLQKDKSGAK